MMISLCLFVDSHKKMELGLYSIDEDRRRRLRQLEERIQDPRSVANVDCLLVSLFSRCCASENVHNLSLLNF